MTCHPGAYVFAHLGFRRFGLGSCRRRSSLPSPASLLRLAAQLTRAGLFRCPSPLLLLRAEKITAPCAPRRRQSPLGALLRPLGCKQLLSKAPLVSFAPCVLRVRLLEKSKLGKHRVDHLVPERKWI